MKNIHIILVTFLFTQLTFAKKGFNPDIGLNAIFEYSNTKNDSEDDGFSLSEIEMQFSSDIDAYLRGAATIAIHQEHAHEDEAETEEHSGYAVEPEEVFVETIALPLINLKVGKFLIDAGKFNVTHTHARMFVTRSRLENKIFGDEGLSEVGLSGSYLIPLPFFSEITLGAFSPKNDEVFGDLSSHDFGYNTRLKALFELSDSKTLDFGFTYLATKNDGEKSKVEILGADMTFKFISVDSASKNHFSLVSEYLKKKSSSDSTVTDGLSVGFKYQLSQRTYFQYRFEDMGVVKDSSVQGMADTILLAFVPSEFSSIRLQYDRLKFSGDNKITLQLNISMGAHPAHSY